jgi:hypothetical protein
MEIFGRMAQGHKQITDVGKKSSGQSITSGLRTSRRARLIFNQVVICE